MIINPCVSAKLEIFSGYIPEELNERVTVPDLLEFMNFIIQLIITGIYKIWL